MTTNPPPLAAPKQVAHKPCPSCDGEGVDLREPPRRVGPYGDYRPDDCSDCKGTGDAPCVECETPSPYLSSNGLCDECCSAESAQAVVNFGYVRHLIYDTPERTPHVLEQLKAISVASQEWACFRDEMQARAEDYARTHGMAVVDLDSLPF